MDRKLTLTATLAAALAGLSGCSGSDDMDLRASSDTRVCVDDWGQRIDDDYCEGGRRYAGAGSFFYLRRGAPIPYYYESVRNKKYAQYGSYNRGSGIYAPAPASTNMARSSAVARGGLGRSGRSFGSRGG